MGQPHGISKLDLKRQNRMQILYTLRHSGPLSRIDISNRIGLTRAAVTIIINDMIAGGVLHEVGEMQYSLDSMPKGRKKILVDINENYRFALGALVEDSQVSVGLCNLSGGVMDKRQFRYDGAQVNKESILTFISEACSALLENNYLEPEALLGLGVGIQPAMYDTLNLPTDSNQTPDFSKLVEQLKETINLPVLVSNSICGLAIANVDFWRTFKPLEPPPKSFIFLRPGLRYNAILVHNGVPQNHFTHHTRLVERIIVWPGGNKAEGFPDGSVRGELCHDVFLEMIKSKVYSREGTPTLWQLTEGDKNKLLVEHILSGVINGDEDLTEITGDWVMRLGILLNNLVCSMNPDRVIIHSCIPGEQEALFMRMRISQLFGDVGEMIRPSIIDAKNSFLGGCALIIRENFFNRGGQMCENFSAKGSDEEY